MAKIIVEIDESGKTEVRVEGVKGRSCKDITRRLESDLGLVASSKPMPEYLEQEVKKIGKKELANSR